MPRRPRTLLRSEGYALGPNKVEGSQGNLLFPPMFFASLLPHVNFYPLRVKMLHSLKAVTLSDLC